MTDAQKDTLAKINDLMREHFNSGVLAVVCCEIETDDSNDEIHVAWTGGYANAYGLLELGKLQMVADRLNNYGRDRDGPTPL